MISVLFIAVGGELILFFAIPFGTHTQRFGTMNVLRQLYAPLSKILNKCGYQYALIVHTNVGGIRTIQIGIEPFA